MYIYFHWTKNFVLIIAVIWWSRVVNPGNVMMTLYGQFNHSGYSLINLGNYQSIQENRWLDQTTSQKQRAFKFEKRFDSIKKRKRSALSG
jgi:hypothetical protein